MSGEAAMVKDNGPTAMALRSSISFLCLITFPHCDLPLDFTIGAHRFFRRVCYRIVATQQSCSIHGAKLSCTCSIFLCDDYRRNAMSMPEQTTLPCCFDSQSSRSTRLQNIRAALYDGLSARLERDHWCARTKGRAPRVWLKCSATTVSSAGSPSGAPIPSRSAASSLGPGDSAL